MLNNYKNMFKYINKFHSGYIWFLQNQFYFDFELLKGEEYIGGKNYISYLNNSKSFELNGDLVEIFDLLKDKTKLPLELKIEYIDVNTNNFINANNFSDKYNFCQISSPIFEEEILFTYNSEKKYLELSYNKFEVNSN